jgi:hypothetical protein
VKISLGRPVLPNRRKQIFQLTVGKRRAPRARRQRESQKNSIDEGGHALTLSVRVEFSKRGFGSYQG